jgi:hypothetical protein
MLAGVIDPEPPNAEAQPPAPPPAGPVFELPSPRAVVGRGFDLVVGATSRLRRASLYVGLLVPLMVGPAVALGGAAFVAAPERVEELLTHPEVFSRALRAGQAAPSVSTLLSVTLLFFFLLGAALVGIVAVAIEAQIIGIAILGGELSGRPLRLREAVLRSRQTFWRVFRAAVLVGIPVSISQGLLGQALAELGVSGDGAEVLAGFGGALVGAPFAYVPSGIVLGDVGAREALARSTRLARTRWRLALVVALFPAVFSSVQIFALGAGGDLAARFAEAANLGFGAPVQAAVTVFVILALVAAIGSLVFTMSAVLAAPQVVAFVGLTHFVAGLDLARRAVAAGVPAPGYQAVATPSGTDTATPSSWTAAPPVSRFRWISRPLLVGVIARGLLAAWGMTLLVSVGSGG